MRSRSRRAFPVRFAAVTLAAVLAGAVLTVIQPASPASAASGSDFDPGFIISDDTFYNSGTMTQAQIQAFLDSKVPTCYANGGPTCLRFYTTPTASKPADSYCSGYVGVASESAASIIQKVAVSCGINPQVLLVLLQKEQGLVTSTAPTDYKYRAATGYGCPDTAACDAEYYGFQNQVYNAARQFQRYAATSGSWGYQPGRNNQIGYHPDAACGSKTVFIQNQATASLYIYTPYTPNDAALANIYGTGDGCSSYGNRNFFRYFSDWFGNPGNLLRSPSFEGGSVNGWGASNGFINQALYNNPALAQSGNWFLATNTPVSGRALSQDVARSTAVGELITTALWVRSESGTFTGTLALWALGGTNELNLVNFTATTTWQQISVGLPIKRSNHSTMRLDLYLASPGTTLWIDSGLMTSGPAPIERNLLAHPSFEGAFDNWIPGNGFVNQQVHQDPRAQDGNWFAASNTPVVGRSFAQDFYVTTKPYERYTFTIWLRASDAPFSGSVALWRLGGSSAEVSVVDYTVTSDGWTKVETSIDVENSMTNQLRVEVYMGSVGTTLWLDNGALTRNLLSAGSFEAPAFDGWQRTGPGINYAVYSQGSSGVSPAHGSYFTAFNTDTAGGSLFQDVKRRPVVGEVYVAELWVRSGGPGASGTIAVWPMGGAALQVFSQPFTATGDWQKISFDVPITQEKLTSFRFQVYLDTAFNDLYIDGAQLR